MMSAPFLHRCFFLAEQARGKTGINPMVGAVLVRDGKIIAEGFHSEFGKAHAELQLLENFEQKIRSTDTLYVNLEPCVHENKKTPPCAQMLIEKGIKNIVIGMQDPNPQVSGKGIELLRSSGVNVTIGFESTADCLRLNRGYVSLMTKARPWITLKQARTTDGTIANADGSPLAITSALQNEWSHTMLRAKHDAICVGIGTILQDDPELNVRYLSPHAVPQNNAGEPWRIIMDPNLHIPLTARVLRKRTIVIASSPDIKKANILEEKGVRVLDIPMRQGIFDWNALWNALTAPDGDFHGIASILVEGGKKTWENFTNASMIDEEVILLGT